MGGRRRALRDSFVDSLGDLAHSRFLAYLMGPYKTFDIDSMLEDTDAEAAIKSQPDSRVSGFRDASRLRLRRTGCLEGPTFDASARMSV